MISVARYLNIVTRRLSSALYVTGDKAQDHFTLLTPHIDFDEQLQNKQALENSIKNRGINVNLERIQRRWYLFKYLDEQKITLEAVKKEIGKEIVDQLKQGKNVDELKLNVKLLKEDLKVLRNYLYGVEESAALGVLQLPNVIHPRTPDDAERLLFEHLAQPQASPKSYMEIAGPLIKYVNPYFFFLRGEAALFEHLLTNYASTALASFTQISNSDFCRTAIAEGCCTDFRDATVFTLESSADDAEYSRTHLVGSASIYSFMAYFAKHLVTENRLPLRLYTVARKYGSKTGNQPILLSVNQGTAVDVFLALKDNDSETESEFEGLISKVTEIYKALGYHFRLVYVPAKDLKSYESLRVNIQMFSNFSQTYVEVGHCSIIDSFLSKRLLFTYNVNKERKFVRIITGTLINVPPMLACVLENNGRSDYLLSHFLKRFYNKDVN